MLPYLTCCLRTHINQWVDPRPPVADDNDKCVCACVCVCVCVTWSALRVQTAGSESAAAATTQVGSRRRSFISAAQ